YRSARFQLRSLRRRRWVPRHRERLADRRVGSHGRPRIAQRRARSDVRGPCRARRHTRRQRQRQTLRRDAVLPVRDGIRGRPERSVHARSAHATLRAKRRELLPTFHRYDAVAFLCASTGVAEMLIQTSRRSFMTALAAAGVAAPVALTLGRSAMAAPGDVRAMFLYVPDGVIPSAWHPSASGTNFTWPAMSAPLEAVREDVVFVRGTNMYAGAGTHEGGIAKVLTGAGDVSLDVYLGQQIGGNT